ncbi:esterase/lipase family protein [Caldimonas brevitalea]|uniref:Lipase n=1 Tax=Caldimonas brevitalea TaxID=413882 RepID=A0A0G3BUM9_9BURK|nr:alpha/beta hydrolase [Caldimonas brevitalea]AKJ30240.1 lipase [Caldimonas brevitalea]
MKKNFRAMLSGVACGALLACGSVAAQTEPIVFVHGYSGSSSNWNTMVGRFKASGYPAELLYTFDYNSFVNANSTSGSELRSFVESVRARHGNATVSIVAHSNGGLVTRWYRTQLGGQAAMRRFVSLGSPHKGTNSAYACYSPACYDMRPGSSFLNTLAGRGCDRSLWSNTDEIIQPVTSAQCGSSTRTPDVSHNGLLSDERVYQQVREQLQ